MRDGVTPSRVWLPQGVWATLADFLLERFVHLSPDILLARLARGDIVDEHGVAQRGDSPYLPLRWLWYYRQVPTEAAIPFDLPVLFRDRYLVAVDKPHFLASIPGGRYLQETALIRLRRALNMPDLSPIHRLDRDTAGVMLFCADPASRGAYQTLFQSRAVHKEYEAIAPLASQVVLPQVYRSRLQQRAGHFTVQEVPGEHNSETGIDLIAADVWGHYRLQPVTGRKHQLRAHMAALGIPIRHDMFYPELCQRSDVDDFKRPLQLLARAIAFTDPVSGVARRFESLRTLQGIA
ncbi:MAG: pseudouridine synthase [Burkholderiaceae bacterium]|nr:pseudouridine synthase [Burkholderiaceae bacterium]